MLHLDIMPSCLCRHRRLRACTFNLQISENINRKYQYTSKFDRLLTLYHVTAENENHPQTAVSEYASGSGSGATNATATSTKPAQYRDKTPIEAWALCHFYTFAQ